MWIRNKSVDVYCGLSCMIRKHLRTKKFPQAPSVSCSSLFVLICRGLCLFYSGVYHQQPITSSVSLLVSEFLFYFHLLELKSQPLFLRSICRFASYRISGLSWRCSAPDQEGRLSLNIYIFDWTKSQRTTYQHELSVLSLRLSCTKSGNVFGWDYRESMKSNFTIKTNRIDGLRF